MDYLLSFGRAAGMFIIGLVAFRLMGSQSVARLTDFDLVVVIAIGALIGDALAVPAVGPWVDRRGWSVLPKAFSLIL